MAHETYRWNVTHRHTQGPERCSEVLTLGREGLSGRLRLVFRGGDGYGVQDGWLHAGAVVRYEDDTYLNLNLPSTARAFLDVLLADGADFTRTKELDGWGYLDAAHAEVQAARARKAAIG
ncbi:hypothetical protein SRB5_10990 [Streptomyces sp. RB5]|uniref:Uncharacterized protein n=1 Tax=Streptomyces smaragdinus TaxID=2585196 RepID=A0A7K0CC09_9ACTN|nr:hypothetical protein [Streptomyces smaragdinus]